MDHNAGAPRVAIIDNSIFPETYQPVAHWRRHLPMPGEAFTARRGRFPDLRRFSHVILTGSEASILDRAPWVEEEVEIVREAVRRDLHVLGSCWGHQLLALALAGPAHVGRCGGPEIGWIPVRVTVGDDLLGEAGREFWTFSIHYDEVRGLDGGSFEVLASTDHCGIQAMRLKDRPVWGLQCHPEIDIPTGEKTLRGLLEKKAGEGDVFRRALAAPRRDSGLIRRIVAAFLGRPLPPA
ncbi:MAG: hypothetical protein ABFD80_02845 [Acidobacteriota bacterium]